jgi:hypothetical protein
MEDVVTACAASALDIVDPDPRTPRYLITVTVLGCRLGPVR